MSNSNDDNHDNRNNKITEAGYTLKNHDGRGFSMEMY